MREDHELVFLQCKIEVVLLLSGRVWNPLFPYQQRTDNALINSVTMEKSINFFSLAIFLIISTFKRHNLVCKNVSYFIEYCELCLHTYSNGLAE